MIKHRTDSSLTKLFWVVSRRSISFFLVELKAVVPDPTIGLAQMLKAWLYTSGTFDMRLSSTSIDELTKHSQNVAFQMEMSNVLYIYFHD